MGISYETLREIEAVSRANQEYEEAKDLEAKRIRAVAEAVAEAALYAHSRGVDIRRAIVGAVIPALEDA